MNNNPFTEDYFLRGPESGLSNFTDYSWKPDATIGMVTHLKRYLRMQDGEFLLEIGCARGFYVRALRMMGVRAFGYDISEWAIANCDPEVKAWVSNHLNPIPRSYDVVFSKDTLEHVPHGELRDLVEKMLDLARRKVFLIVPLASESGGPYVHPKEENDSTHVIRWTLPDWLIFLQQCSPAFVVNGSYRFPGLKPGSFEVEQGYGFFTLERI